jgi:HAD superfamily hydrolase (TIGR01509 family)
VSDPAPVELVCFDLGGVLVRVCGSWSEAAAQVGAPDLMPLDDPRVAESVYGLLLDFEVGQVDSAHVVERLVSLSGGYDTQHIAAIIEGWLKGPYDGADRLLDRIRHAGVITACLSNTNAWHWRVMADRQSYPMLGQLDYHFASHLAGARKPDAPFYETLERQTGVRPDRIVFFDDLEMNVQTACARGWMGRQVDADRDPIRQVAGHLADLGVLADPDAGRGAR